ncbi:MAG: alkaline phosphatase family protein [Actinomycetota bacterium]
MARRTIGLWLVAALAVGAAGTVALVRISEEPAPSFRAQMCGLPEEWLLSTQRGYFEERSGQIALLPKQPAYMATGGGGWSHSGPWPYLQDVPLVVYGPGIVPAVGNIERPVTVADIAPTIAALLHGQVSDSDGTPLAEVANVDEVTLGRKRPKLIVTIVWDGGGWNTLEQWPGDWKNLLAMMEGGVSYTNATVGSNPSVTPAVHTTIGTGVFPWKHGVTGVPVRDEQGEVVDSFLEGESSRFIRVPTIAERWDEQNGQRALVGMLGYEPWHLGMIGQGAERPTGDKDHGIWLNTETNEWKTNPSHYSLPASVTSVGGLEEYIAELDAADGAVDEAWLDNEILGTVDRWEETPAFIRFHREVMENMIAEEGYGDDRITDLLFTNFKQIDRVGHYFNMDSEEVNQSLLMTDSMLGEFLEFLDDEVGRGDYVVFLTADHGQQPDAPDVNGYAIDPNEVKADINAEFGEVTRAVWPTEVFLLEDEMAELGVTVEDVARFLSTYTVGDNLSDPNTFTGTFSPSDRIFALSTPSSFLTSFDPRIGDSCGAENGA